MQYAVTAKQLRAVELLLDHYALVDIATVGREADPGAPRVTPLTLAQRLPTSLHRKFVPLLSMHMAVQKRLECVRLYVMFFLTL